MIRCLTDEDFDGGILRVLRRRRRRIDVLLTHDVTTMTAKAYARIRRGEPMAGMFAVPQFAPRRPVLDSLELLNEASGSEGRVDRVAFLPFR